MKTRGEIPCAIRASPAALAKSNANCAASASTRTGQSSSEGVGSPASASTATGPTAYQALPSRTSTRSSFSFPSKTSMTSPSSIPAATHKGTMPSGSRKSIGTNTSCVGIARPEPISNSTLYRSA